jgi:hypothetical protein
MGQPGPSQPHVTVTIDQRIIVFAAVLVGLLIAGLVWYFAVYDTAQNKCSRGDVGACIVVGGQQAEAQASASAEAAANAAAAEASPSAAAAEASASAQQQQAQASASAEASAAAQQAAVAAKEQATCGRVGGAWAGNICQIDYRSPRRRPGLSLHHFIRCRRQRARRQLQ